MCIARTTVLLFALLRVTAVAQEKAHDPPAAHFHHLHLNATDPAADIEFYTGKFDCERGKFAGMTDGVWAQKSWILFTRVSIPPAWQWVTAIWHFGWGAEDMRATYRKQLDMGTNFQTPLTDISRLANHPGFYYAYVDGPDRALIELNTAQHHHFGHLHLFSEDPVSAGEWYVKNLGAAWRSGRVPARTPRFYNEYQVGPAASLVSDNVNVIIFPVEFAKKAYPNQWRDRTTFESTKGHVVDHIGFSVDNLAEALDRLRKNNVRVTEDIRTALNGKIKHAFIEGPDKIRIELVEGRAVKE